MSGEIEPDSLALMQNLTRYKIKFHQNHVLAVWNIDGYHVYKVNSVGKLTQNFSQRRGNDAEAIIVEPFTFYNGARVENMIVLIKKNPFDVTPILELQRFETSLEMIRPTIMFSQPVLAFTSSREYLAVVMERSIYIYSIGMNGNIITGSEKSINTEENDLGICAISDRYLVYPCTTSRDNRGILDVRILNTQLSRQTVLYAHRSHPVIALTFSASGTSLATASRNHIRVFSVLNFSCDWLRVYQFNINTSEIPTLNFSRCSEYIVCNGRSPTIYIFRLTEDNKLTNILAGIYHVHRPPINYNYSLTVFQPYPIQKVVAIRYIYGTLYLYIFNEFAVYELYWYNYSSKQFVSFGPENFAESLVQNLQSLPHPPRFRR